MINQPKYKDVVQELMAKFHSRSPFVLFTSYDSMAPLRILQNIAQSNDLDSFNHILQSGSSVEYFNDGAWADADSMLESDKNGVPRRAGGGGGFVNEGLIPENSIVYYPQLYRAWIGEGRLGTRAGTEMVEYYNACKKKDVVNILYAPYKKLPDDHASLFQHVRYPYPDEYERKQLISQVSGSTIQDRDGVLGTGDYFSEEIAEATAGLTGDQVQQVVELGKGAFSDDVICKQLGDLVSIDTPLDVEFVRLSDQNSVSIDEYDKKYSDPQTKEDVKKAVMYNNNKRLSYDEPYIRLAFLDYTTGLSYTKYDEETRDWIRTKLAYLSPCILIVVHRHGERDKVRQAAPNIDSLDGVSIADFDKGDHQFKLFKQKPV